MSFQPAPPKTSVEVVGRLAEGQPGCAGGSVDEYAGVVECLRVFRHAGFFFACGGVGRSQFPGTNPMDQPASTVAHQIAHAAGAFEQQRNGHVPQLLAEGVF